MLSASVTKPEISLLVATHTFASSSHLAWTIKGFDFFMFTPDLEIALASARATESVARQFSHRSGLQLRDAPLRNQVGRQRVGIAAIRLMIHVIVQRARLRVGALGDVCGQYVGHDEIR